MLDALLYAAAPELLEALRMLVTCIPVESDPSGIVVRHENGLSRLSSFTPNALEQARAAIAKAEGR